MALSKKFHALVAPDNYEALSVSYFLLENSFKYLRQLDSAGYYNQRRIEVLEKSGTQK